MKQIKVLAFDTGGTVLDWHAGLTAAMAAWGTAHGIERDWHALANEHRRRSLRRMTGRVEGTRRIGTAVLGPYVVQEFRPREASSQKVPPHSRRAYPRSERR